MKAQDLKVGQRIRVGSADGQILSLAGDNGWLIQFPIFMEGISFAILDSIGFEVIEPLVIRDVVRYEQLGLGVNYLLSGGGTLGDLLRSSGAQPGDMFDLVLTKREAN